MGYKRKQTRKRFVLQTTNDWFFYNIYKVFFVLLHALRTRAYRGRPAGMKIKNRNEDKKFMLLFCCSKK